MASGEDKWIALIWRNAGMAADHWADRSKDAREMMSLDDRIALARYLLEQYGQRLIEEKTVQQLLTRLKKGMERSHRTMRYLGVSDACAQCDAHEPEGSCCSTGLEKKIDSPLLLINGLLGVSLHERGIRRGSCAFLGDRGCILKVRHMLCIDYLCPKLEHGLGREKLILMQQATEDEIEALFLLREEIDVRLLQWLDRRSRI